MNINPAKPIEELIGDNRGIVRMILGNVHCSCPLSYAARAVYSKLCAKRRETAGLTLRGALAEYPRPLRRGLALCIVETWDEYTQQYREIRYGTFANRDQDEDHAAELAEIVADCHASTGL